jgi:hypothetical protein
MATKKKKQQPQTASATTAHAQVQYATGVFGNSPTLQDVSGQVLNRYGRALSTALTPVATHSVPVITYEKMQSHQTNPTTDQSSVVTRQGVVLSVHPDDIQSVKTHLETYDGQLNGVMYKLVEQQARTQ